MRIEKKFSAKALSYGLPFLDIDGVLNNNHSNISSESIDVIKQLIQKNNAKVVMITSHQQNGTDAKRNSIKQKLEELDIYNIDFIDPNFEGYILDIKLPSRILGIVDYLKKNEVSNYVILDDDYTNDYKLVCLNHYKTNPQKGLTNKDLSKITFKSVNIKNFKNISYQYRQLGEYELLTNNLVKILKNKYERHKNNN